MIGKIGTVPTFKGRIEITAKTFYHPIITFDTDELKRIDGKPNGDVKLTMKNGCEVNVLKEAATMQDILCAYAATKDSSLTVNIRKEDPSIDL